MKRYSLIIGDKARTALMLSTRVARTITCIGIDIEDYPTTNRISVIVYAVP